MVVALPDLARENMLLLAESHCMRDEALADLLGQWQPARTL